LHYFKSSHESGRIIKSESVINLTKEDTQFGVDTILFKEIESFNKKKMKRQVKKKLKINKVK